MASQPPWHKKSFVIRATGMIVASQSFKNVSPRLLANMEHFLAEPQILWGIINWCVMASEIYTVKFCIIRML